MQFQCWVQNNGRVFPLLMKEISNIGAAGETTLLPVIKLIPIKWWIENSHKITNWLSCSEGWLRSKCRALSLGALSVHVNLWWSLVSKGYFYVLGNWGHALKSLQVWMPVLFVSLEKLFHWTHLYSKKSQMLRKHLCQTDKAHWHIPLPQHVRRQNKSQDIFRFFICGRSLRTFDSLGSQQLWRSYHICTPKFIRNIRTLCETRTNNKQEIQPRVQNREARLTGCPLSPCRPRGPVAPVSPRSPFCNKR